MNKDSTTAEIGTHPTPSRRDGGTTFVEALVAVVLLGLGGVATMTALRTSIQGSDQHKSKVAALSELEGAGAYLQREANDRDCGSTPVADQTYYASALPSRPGIRNDGVTVSVTGVVCTSGLPIVSLTAAHARGNATESLNVTVGGISVAKNGDGTGGPAGPGSGACTWVTASATPVSVNKSGSQLSQPVTVRLTYTGGCSSATASAYLYQVSPPRNITLTMSAAGSGIFEATLAANSGVNWQKAVVSVDITTTGPPGTFSTTFTVT